MFHERTLPDQTDGALLRNRFVALLLCWVQARFLFCFGYVPSSCLPDALFGQSVRCVVFGPAALQTLRYPAHWHSVRLGQRTPQRRSLSLCRFYPASFFPLCSRVQSSGATALMGVDGWGARLW